MDRFDKLMTFIWLMVLITATRRRVELQEQPEAERMRILRVHGSEALARLDDSLEEMRRGRESG